MGGEWAASLRGRRALRETVRAGLRLSERLPHPLPAEAGARRHKGRKAWRRERPSRPRPWQAVAVAETAGIVGGDEGSGPGSDAGHRRLKRAPRNRHRRAPPDRGTPAPERSGICRVPYPPMAELSNTARPAVFLIRPYGRFRTPQELPWFEMVVWRPLRTTQGSPWFEISALSEAETRHGDP